MADVYLSLGSNLGDRRANLRRALSGLRDRGTIAAVSRIYETEPVGPAEQPSFLNLTCHMRTELSPHALLDATGSIERHLGREASIQNEPRPIDIDILLYDSLVLAEPDLTIPHPRFDERAFVLVPLAEIAPDVRDPRSNATVGNLLRRLQDTHWVRPYNGGAMYRLFVEDHFDAAHYLPEYHGKCERMHGHRFKVILRVAADSVGADGMAYDFAEMKRHLRNVLEALDHTCLNELPMFSANPPSSENVAAWLFAELKPIFDASPVSLDAIEVWESPTSGVSYSP